MSPEEESPDSFPNPPWAKGANARSAARMAPALSQAIPILPLSPTVKSLKSYRVNAMRNPWPGNMTTRGDKALHSLSWGDLDLTTILEFGE